MAYNNLNNNTNSAIINDKSSFLINNAESMSGEEWLRLLEEENTYAEADEYAQYLITCVKNIINSNRPKWCEVKGAKILSYDEKNSLATLEFPDANGTWSNVKNQSIYQNLKSGDAVKVLIQHQGDSADHWIIGAHGNRENPYVKINEQLTNMQSMLNSIVLNMQRLQAQINNLDNKINSINNSN